MSDIAITHAQARARAEGLLMETAAALTPQPRLERIDYWEAPTPCEFSEEGIPKRFTIGRAYWLRDIPKGDHMGISRRVRSHWEKLGHTITSTGDIPAGRPDLVAKSYPDGFILALAWAEGDNLYLAATSPCLEAQETPEP